MPLNGYNLELLFKFKNMGEEVDTRSGIDVSRETDGADLEVEGVSDRTAGAVLIGVPRRGVADDARIALEGGSDLPTIIAGLEGYQADGDPRLSTVAASDLAELVRCLKAFQQGAYMTLETEVYDLVNRGNMPLWILRYLTESDNPVLRAAACVAPNVSWSILSELDGDEDSRVNLAAVSHPNYPLELLEKYFVRLEHGSKEGQRTFAHLLLHPLLSEDKGAFLLRQFGIVACLQVLKLQGSGVGNPMNPNVFTLLMDYDERGAVQDFETEDGTVTGGRLTIAQLEILRDYSDACRWNCSRGLRLYIQARKMAQD